MHHLTLAVLALAAVPAVVGHGALVYPPGRNSIDRLLPSFAGGKSESTSCNCGDSRIGCDQGVRATMGGQPCLWFSQGCSIGCPTCTGIGSHTNVSLCGATMKPTLPVHAWTMNRGATPGSAQDSYRFNPWRAPGHAPVSDSCGTAGGTVPSQKGPGDAVFATTPYAAFGDIGSAVLPPSLNGIQWKAGASVEVSWGIRFNHGGGYQYRLCPSNESLTEECFFRTPLEFVRDKQALQWTNGTRLPIPGTFVDTGTLPPGSTWAMNPIPRIDYDSTSSGQPSGFTGCSLVHGEPVGPGCRQFDPPCSSDDGWFAQPPYHANVDVEGACSGDWTGGRIVDTVVIPKDLTAGDYVLGWRWDCEESTQVWSNCADVTIV